MTRNLEIETLLDGAFEDESVVPAVVGILQRGWSDEVQDEVVALRKRKGAQLQDYSKDHFDSFSHRIEELGTLRQFVRSLKQRIIELNEVIQYAGSEVMNSREKISTLKRTKEHLKLASESVAVYLSAVAILKRTKQQSNAGSFVPALRSLTTLRKVLIENQMGESAYVQPSNDPSKKNLTDTNFEHVHGASDNMEPIGGFQCERSILLQHLLRLIPVIQLDIKQRAKKHLIGWFKLTVPHGKLFGQQAMDRVSRDLLCHHDTSPMDGQEPKLLLLRYIRGLDSQLERMQSNSSTLEFENDFSIAPVLQFVHVHKLLKCFPEAGSYYVEKREQQLRLWNSIPNESVNRMSVSDFSQHYRQMIEHIIGFFLLETEVSNAVKLFKRTELNLLWKQETTAVVHLLLSHIKNPDEAFWQKRPVRLLHVIDTVSYLCHVFKTPRVAWTSSQVHSHEFDTETLVDMISSNESSFRDSLSHILEQYTIRLVNHGCFFMGHHGVDSDAWQEQLASLSLDPMHDELTTSTANLLTAKGLSLQSNQLSVGIIAMMALSLSVSRTCYLLSSTLNHMFVLQQDSDIGDENESTTLFVDAQVQSALSGAKYVLCICARRLEVMAQETSQTLERLCGLVQNCRAMEEIWYMVQNTIFESYSSSAAGNADGEDDANRGVRNDSSNNSSIARDTRSSATSLVQFQRISQATSEKVCLQVERCLDDLLDSGSTEWAPSAPPPPGQTHEFVDTALSYLKSALSPAGIVASSLNGKLMQRLCFRVCEQLSDYIVGILTVPGAPRTLNSHDLRVLASDVNAVEGFATSCRIPGLRESLDLLSQLVQVLSEERIWFFLDAQASSELFPKVTKSLLVKALQKIQDVSSGLFTSSAHKLGSGILTYKTAQKVLKELTEAS